MSNIASVKNLINTHGWFDYEAVIKTLHLLLCYLSVKRPAVEKNVLLCVCPFVLAKWTKEHVLLEWLYLVVKSSECLQLVRAVFQNLVGIEFFM